MIEILNDFEQVAGRLSPAVLVAPGIVATAAGLVIWLGGLGFRRLSLALVGAVAGAAVVYGAGLHRPAVAAISILAAALVAVIMPRLLTAILLGALSSAVLFVVLAWPCLAQSKVGLTGRSRTIGSTQRLSARQSLDLIQGYGLDMTDNIKHAAEELGLTKWLAVAVVGVVATTTGLLFKRTAGALSCSLVGTLLIWAGLVVLLMFKGSTPVRRIQSNVLAYGLAALAMTAFGTVEQYLLCKRADRKRAAKSRRKQDPDEESKPNWRDH